MRIAPGYATTTDLYMVKQFVSDSPKITWPVASKTILDEVVLGARAAGLPLNLVRLQLTESILDIAPWLNPSFKHSAYGGVISYHTGETVIAVTQWAPPYRTLQCTAVRARGCRVQETVVFDEPELAGTPVQHAMLALVFSMMGDTYDPAVFRHNLGLIDPRHPRGDKPLAKGVCSREGMADELPQDWVVPCPMGGAAETYLRRRKMRAATLRGAVEQRSQQGDDPWGC